MAAARRVVLFPSLGVGHLTPMLELAAVCIRHGLAVTVAVPDPAITAPAFSATLREYASRLPSLSVHFLPPPPAHHLLSPDAHPLVRMLAVLRALASAALRDLLRGPHAAQALVADMFSVYAIDVAAEVGVPGYLLFCTGAANLAVFLRLPHLCSGSGGSLRELGDKPVSFPGLRPLPASHFPDEVLDRGTDISAAMLDAFDRMADARGILVNTFEALESTGVAALRSGRCLPNRATPPVYCVGPLIANGDAEEERHQCLAWLDAQPERSVVFLCFGSRGALSPEQVREMATAIERSGQRFLWVLRAPAGASATEPDAALALLPDGFLARTADRVFVVTASWAPQVAVLQHASTGAFSTHCGWNSTLEAVAAGVPMVCWPLDAEQWMNKVFIVEEMKVGIEVRGYKPGVLVRADIIDATVRRIMEPEERQGVLEKVMAAKESAAAAWKEGGSSCVAFGEFLKNMEEDNVAMAHSSQVHVLKQTSTPSV
ncbi:anthocyanidin 5,3-O-glucosyltransferase-like [Oryza brachyantha]|uniref:Glycosyltransferase n=1 Tax=Oryza brachyantha TaxID=4533 RepID=J3MDW1_ORYBR|nr:anthocyanidin 5,3-O-glucosyltransferase-like [Oryza brachyantha]